MAVRGLVFQGRASRLRSPLSTTNPCWRGAWRHIRSSLIDRPAQPMLLGTRVAPVAELVDALDSKSSSARSAGSIPARGTTSFKTHCFCSLFRGRLPHLVEQTLE